MKKVTKILHEDYGFYAINIEDKEDEQIEELYDEMSNNYDMCPAGVIMDVEPLDDSLNNILSIYEYFDEKED